MSIKSRSYNMKDWLVISSSDDTYIDDFDTEQEAIDYWQSLVDEAKEETEYKDIGYFMMVCHKSKYYEVR